MVNLHRLGHIKSKKFYSINNNLTRYETFVAFADIQKFTKVFPTDVMSYGFLENFQYS